MKKITIDGKTLVTLFNPTYIRLHENGSYVLTDEPHAEGVVVDGTPYHIEGRPGMYGFETDVIVSEVNEESEFINKEEIQETQTAIDELMLDHEERLILLEVGE